MQSWINEGVGIGLNFQDTGGGPRRSNECGNSYRGGTRKTNMARMINDNTQMPAAMSPASQLPTHPDIGEPPPVGWCSAEGPGRIEAPAMFDPVGDVMAAVDWAVVDSACSACPPIHRCMPMMPVRRAPRHNRSRKACRWRPVLPESITSAILSSTITALLPCCELRDNSRSGGHTAHEYGNSRCGATCSIHPHLARQESVYLALSRPGW